MSNYLNYNLFNQIAQSSNYDKKVAMAQKDLEFATEMETRANKRVQEQAMGQEKVGQYIEAIDEKIGQLLPQDEARIRELEKQKRQMVIKGIADSQGDYKQFLLQGGGNVLRDYKKSVLDSDEVASALHNKTTYDSIKKAMENQHFLKDVDVQYETNDGKAVQERVDVDTMMKLFNAGKIKSLNYRGSQKGVDLKPMDFQKNPHPDHPYEPSQVTVDEYIAFAVAKGQDPEIAAKMAQQQVRGVNAQGQPVTDFWWGVEDDDWRGNSRAWGANSKNRAGAKKFFNVIETIPQMVKMDEKARKTDWWSKDGKSKERMTIQRYNPGADIVDEIKGHLGLILNSDGSYTGNITNSIGFTNMENGRRHNIKGSDYELIGTGNEVEVVRDAKTGELEMYMPINIRVSEDYMEDHLGEGAWWNGWTLESNKFGGVTRDVDYNGEDTRELQVSVNIPLDPLNRQRLNQKIGMETDNVIGGMYSEDYYSTIAKRPEGAVGVPQRQKYANLNGQMFSTTSSNGQLSDADKYMQTVVEAEKMIRSNPKFSNLDSRKIRTLAQQYAQQNM
jgi:hypothetical protein